MGRHLFDSLDWVRERERERDHFPFHFPGKSFLLAKHEQRLVCHFFFFFLLYKHLRFHFFSSFFPSLVPQILTLTLLAAIICSSFCSSETRLSENRAFFSDSPWVGLLMALDICSVVEFFFLIGALMFCLEVGFVVNQCQLLWSQDDSYVDSYISTIGVDFVSLSIYICW